MKKPVFVAFLLMTLAMTLIPTSAQSATEPTFVAMMGRVESYGGKPAYGYIGAFAEVNKSAKVGLFWTLQPVHIAVIPYNYTFHAARLVSTEMVELNYSDSDFYVSGLWDVYNVTFCYKKDGNFTLIVELWVDDGFGELNVLDNWKTFTVDIKGIQEVAGIVLRYCVRPIKPIPRGDVTGPYAPGVPDGEIDIYDLVHVAKAYGNTPGIGNYYFEVDLTALTDYDFKVDLCDLTTVAANLGESY